jgi:hypothetical protein
MTTAVALTVGFVAGLVVGGVIAWRLIDWLVTGCPHADDEWRPE